MDDTFASFFVSGPNSLVNENLWKFTISSAGIPLIWCTNVKLVFWVFFPAAGREETFRERGSVE